jgi:HCOMODA/2-hydroxy-3-carboxy-muconic semialdehyde decarboxylase
MSMDAALAAEVALVARVLARLGLVHAFGHVSARAPIGPPGQVVDNPTHTVRGPATLPHRGTRHRPGPVGRAAEPGAGRTAEPGAGRAAGRAAARVLVTPTFPPLGELQAGDVLELDSSGRVLEGAAERRPLEAPLHLAVYAARPEVGAVCRVHGPAVAAVGASGTAPPLLHGFGGMVEPVAVWDDPDLVAGEQVAGRVAGVLGAAPALLLRGNGGLTVGADLDQALARAWCLEDRCRVALAAGDRARPLTPGELDRRRRWYDAETARLARWLRRAGGG